ncbi:hypothetical protein KQI84_10520 [bacterium]|nr:hypothetical protein [bacterium]
MRQLIPSVRAIALMVCVAALSVGAAMAELSVSDTSIDYGGGTIESSTLTVTSSVTLVEGAAGSSSSSYAIVDETAISDPLAAGDEDRDGHVTLAEMNAAVVAFRGLAPCPSSADANSDGVISVEELNAVVLEYRASLSSE